MVQFPLLLYTRSIGPNPPTSSEARLPEGSQEPNPATHKRTHRRATGAAARSASHWAPPNIEPANAR